jgi:threonine efflux protein
MDASLYLPSLLAFFAAAASPGPATLAVLTTAMSRGARPAIMLGIGLAIGLGFWGLVAAAGLGALLIHSTVALTLLRWFGGAYLLWLAWQSARCVISPLDATEEMDQTPGSRLVLRGLVLNLSNPKAVLAWISVLALGVGTGKTESNLAVTTALCAVMGLLIYLVYAVVFAQAPIRAGYRRAQKAIDGVAAMFFGYSGLKLLFIRPETS